MSVNDMSTAEAARVCYHADAGHLDLHSPEIRDVIIQARATLYAATPRPHPLLTAALLLASGVFLITGLLLFF